MKKLYSEPPADAFTKLATPSEQQLQAAAASQRDRAYLIVISGSNVGEMYRVETVESMIGRGVDAAIRVYDDGASRNHARLLYDQATRAVRIEDLKSSNGTFVNGERVACDQVLNDGDKITVGSTTILKFTYGNDLDEKFQQQMYDAALRDAMTKAFNKKYFLERLYTETAYAIRHKSPLSLLMFDVDHFKKVNDTCGHLAGDTVLIKLSSLVQATLRKEDVLARYGGEEFAIICRGVQAAQAAVLAERLRGRVEATRFAHESHEMTVTISVGVAGLLETGGASETELIASADKALYDAKRQGRNRVVVGDH